jgi:hypothetical protein
MENQVLDDEVMTIQQYLLATLSMCILLIVPFWMMG